MIKLILLRGLPGSGKTTFALDMEEVYFMAGCAVMCVAADDFMIDEFGAYEFDPSRLSYAHRECFDRVDKVGGRWEETDVPGVIIVHNTFTTEKEMKPYLELARERGWRVVSLIVETRHDNASVHNVPLETLEKMKKRFSIQL